jgi:hypothetical protein
MITLLTVAVLIFAAAVLWFLIGHAGLRAIWQRWPS